MSVFAQACVTFSRLLVLLTPPMTGPKSQRVQWQCVLQIFPTTRFPLVQSLHRRASGPECESPTPAAEAMGPISIALLRTPSIQSKPPKVASNVPQVISYRPEHTGLAGTVTRGLLMRAKRSVDFRSENASDEPFQCRHRMPGPGG